MIEVNYLMQPDTWQQADAVVLYSGEVAQARVPLIWDGGPWMAGTEAEAQREPKVLAASLQDEMLQVTLAHPQFDPNVDEAPVRVTGLRIYDDPSYRAPRSRD
jgi:hypothetical protein